MRGAHAAGASRWAEACKELPRTRLGSWGEAPAAGRRRACLPAARLPAQRLAHAPVAVPCLPCRLAGTDFDVLVYTNTYPDAEAAAGGADAYLSVVAPLFERLRDANRQRAVVNVDGGWWRRPSDLWGPEGRL